MLKHHTAQDTRFRDTKVTPGAPNRRAADAPATQYAEWKAQYTIRMRYGLVGALLPAIIAFLVTPNILPKKKSVSSFSHTIQLVEIPPTAHTNPSPAPPRPSVPVVAADEDIPGDVTISPTALEEFITTDHPPAPPLPALTLSYAPEDYIISPSPAGGIEALRSNIRYPPFARQTGIEGTVVIRAYINEQGEVTETAVLQDMPRTGFSDAAITGIQKTRFIPARKFDLTIGYWDSITVKFSIKDN